MPENIKLIKRYQNRKLYDTMNSRYVTLDDIAEMIRAGEGVSIVDNATGEDLTSVTLTQIIFEQQKKHKGILPLGLLTRFIQTGGESMQEFFDKRIAPGIASLAAARAEFERHMEKLIAKGQIPREEGFKIIRDFVGSSQKGIDDLQKRIEKRAKAALKKLRSLASLQQDVEELEAKVAQIERSLADKGVPAAKQSQAARRSKAGRKGPRAKASAMKD